MKNILILLGVCLLASAATAQQYIISGFTNNAGQLLNGGTNFVAGGSTNVYDALIDARKYGSFALEWSYALIAPGTSNKVMQIQNSVTGTNWFLYTNWVTTANGTNPAGGILEIQAGSAGWWRVHSIANTNTPASTNEVVVPQRKPRIS